jgi:hypothetical protein
MSKTIQDLRERLFDAIDGVKNGTMSVDKAKTVADLAQVVVNTAKVEVDYLRANNGGETPFLEASSAANLPEGITGIRQHRLK